MCRKGFLDQHKFPAWKSTWIKYQTENVAHPKSPLLIIKLIRKSIAMPLFMLLHLRITTYLIFLLPCKKNTFIYIKCKYLYKFHHGKNTSEYLPTKKLSRRPIIPSYQELYQGLRSTSSLCRQKLRYLVQTLILVSRQYS